MSAGTKRLLVFYGMTAAVILTLPLVVLALDKLTGGMVGKAYDSTIGAAQSALVAPPATSGVTTASLTEGELGARLVVV
jgi:hypothetical protein